MDTSTVNPRLAFRMKPALKERIGSDRDRNRFLGALNRPGRPIPSLVKTIKTYRKHHSG